MPPSISNHWRTDPEYIELLNFLIERTENVESPMSTRQVIREYKEKSGAAQTVNCLSLRIQRMRTIIHSFEHIDKKTKVKFLFALSASVDADFLEELNEDAFVEVDKKKRITHYKANDGTLEFRGDHSHSAKMRTEKLETNSQPEESDDENSHLDKTQDLLEPSNEAVDPNNKTPVGNRSPAEMSIDNNLDFDPSTERSHTPGETETKKVDKKEDSGITGNAEIKMNKFKMAPPISNRWTTHPPYVDLLNYLTQKAKDAKSPMNIDPLANEFKENSGAWQRVDSIRKRIESVRKLIHSFEHVDEKTKVKLLFALSGSVYPEFLEELKKDAVVEVDDKQRITHYKANDGSLELKGDHSLSAKTKNVKIVKFQSKRSLRSLIIDYCENKNNADAVPKNEDEKEIWNLIEFITEECENSDSPLNIHQLAKDFNKHFETSRSFACTYGRIRTYCLEIQTLEIMDAFTTVKQLFCLSAILDSEYLGKLRKDAVVEVDNLKRITKYTANNGRLNLNRYPSLSAEGKSDWIERKKKNNTVKKRCISGDDKGKESEKENGYSEESDAYSSEKFGSEFNSDNENDILDEKEDLVEQSNKADDFDNETPVIIRSPTEMSIEDNFDFDPPTERSHAPEKIDMREEEKNNLKINPIIKRRSKTLSKRRYSDSEDDSDSYPEESDDENSHLDKTQDLMEPSNEADEPDNDTSVRSLAPSGISIDNNFDLDPPTEKCHVSGETEMREVDEKKDSRITGNAEIKMRKFKMTPLISNRWTTDPEYINLLTYLIEKAKDAKSPMNIEPLAKEFKEKSGAPQTVRCLTARISRTRTHIWSFEHIDKKTKVKLLFALCASVNPEILEELKKDAFVEVNYKQRIIYYKANDGSLELGHYHSVSAINSTALIEPKRSYRSMIKSYFEKKNDHNAVPDNEEVKETGKLIEFIIEKCENIDRPLSIWQLARDFVEKFQTSTLPDTVRYRINGYGQEIQRMESVDTRAKIKQLFGLSATVNSDYLEKLRTEALVDVDEKNRIVHYKANDGTLELRGDHGQAAKNRTAQGSIRSLIINYFKGKNDVDAVLKNDEEEEMRNLIEFITEKCENVDSPLNISQLTKDFNKHFGTSRSSKCIHKRVRAYCHEVQKTEFFDTQSKVKQLFYMSGTLDPDFLKELRKDAVVYVDNLNRITKYTANNGRLTLHGAHSSSAKNMLGWIEREKNSKLVENSWWRCNSGGGEGKESENEKECSEDDSDVQYFIEEIDLNNYDNYIDESEVLMEPSNGTVDFDDDIPVLSPTYMSMDDNFDFDPPTERFHRSDEIEMMEVYGEKNADRITGNTAVKTRKFKMAPPISNRWTTDPQYVDLLNFFILKAKNARSPMNIQSLAKGFKEKSRAPQTVNCIRLRIESVRKLIHIYCYSLLFALSGFLDELKKNAFVKVDEKKQINYYTANDGSLELRRDYSHSAKTENAKLQSKRSLRSLIIDYCENKDDTDAVPKNDDEKEIWNLIDFITEECENADSPLNIIQLARDFNEHFETSRSFSCIYGRIRSYCHEIRTLEIMDAFTTVKQLFCLNAILDPEYLGKLRKDAYVEVDHLNRITKYIANNGRLKLNRDSIKPAKKKSGSFFDPPTERPHRLDEIEMREDVKTRKFKMTPLISNRWTTDPEYINLLTYLIQKAKGAKSPMNIEPLAKEFKEKSGAAQTVHCIRKRINNLRTMIHSFDHIDEKTKVILFFALSGSVNSEFLEELKKNAVVEVDDKQRIIQYKANNGCLELKGDHSQSAKISTARLESKLSLRSLIHNYFKGKNDVDAVPKKDEEKEMWNFIELITEKCKNADSPLNIRQLANDFNNQFGLSRALYCIQKRVRAYCYEIQKAEFFDTQSKVKQLFYMSGTLDPDFLKELRKDAVVDVDDLSRITKYTANNGGLTLHGAHSSSAKMRQGLIERRKNRKSVENSWWRCNSGGGEGKEIDEEDGYSEDDNDQYFIEEFDNEFDLNNYDNYLDEPGILIEPSNEAADFDDDIPVLSPTYMSMDDYFGFGPPTERFHRSDEIEMMEVYGEKNVHRITGNAAVKARKFEALPRTSQTPKRKADTSAGSASSKRTKPLPEEFMNLEEMDDNFSHDDPPRIDLNPFRGPLGLSDGIGEDSDIEEMSMLRPEIIKDTIEEKYEEEAHFSLKSVLKSFKSLILKIDTLGLYQYLVELDMKILESGRRIEVPNKEVMVAMDFLILELTKHGALESSEDSISLREILLMLRTILMNMSFDGVEVILEMLKKNIEQLKAQDKKVPVSKVDSALSATLDIICT